MANYGIDIVDNQINYICMSNSFVYQTTIVESLFSLEHGKCRRCVSPVCFLVENTFCFFLAV